MKNIYIISVLLLEIASVFAQKDDFLRNKYRLLFSDQTKQNITSLKKQLSVQAKPAIAITATGVGTYLLYDTIKAAIDLRKTLQQHTSKGLMLNTLIAGAFLGAGCYLFHHMWNNKTEEKNDHT